MAASTACDETQAVFAARVGGSVPTLRKMDAAGNHDLLDLDLGTATGRINPLVIWSLICAVMAAVFNSFGRPWAIGRCGS